MNLRTLSRRVGIAVAIATVLALAAPYAFVSEPEYATQLTAYYASGVVGAAGIALFALVSAVIIGSVEQGNFDPGTLAGVAVMLSVATTLSAATWAVAIEPTTMFADHRWLEWHAPAVVGISALIPVCAAVYARELLT